MAANRMNIAVIPGDGIGKEVIPEGIRVLERRRREADEVETAVHGPLGIRHLAFAATGLELDPGLRAHSDGQVGGLQAAVAGVVLVVVGFGLTKLDTSIQLLKLFDNDKQGEIFATLGELMRADGVVHPAEKAFLEEGFGHSERIVTVPVDPHTFTEVVKRE